MVTFRSNNSNNNRRPPFRSNNNRRPPFRSNNEGSKFSNNDNFRRSVPGRNNHNAVKLIEKYNDLAREALAQEDRVLSENYFQHADHFTRIQNEQESNRVTRFNTPSTESFKPIQTEDVKETVPATEDKKVIPVTEVKKAVPATEDKKVIPVTEAKKTVKISEKKVVEKKSAAS